MKNINNINEEVSREMNINREDVKSINNFYWKKLKEEVDSLAHSSIFIRDVGTIYLDNRKYRWNLRKLIKIIRNTRNSLKFKDETKKKYNDMYVKELKTLWNIKNVVNKRTNGKNYKGINFYTK